MIVKKNIFLFLSITLILFLVGGFLVYYIVSKEGILKDNTSKELNISQTNTSGPRFSLPHEKEDCKKSNDEAQCLKMGAYDFFNKIAKEAVAKKDAATCDLLVDPLRIEICKVRIASITRDTTLCDNLSIKSECKIQVSLEMKDWNSCKKVEGKDKEKCFIQLMSIMMSRKEADGFCDKILQEDKIICLDIYYSQKAFTFIDYDSCSKISTPKGIEECLKLLPPDSDKDGLSDWYEVNYYHTNPQNKDTDGDGFSDGEEVRTGHNPLK